MTNPLTNTSIAARLDELEMRLTFQDNTLAELNDVVTTQERRIAQLERELTLLKGQMRLMAPSLTASASEETPPPHY
ncbi:MAG: SlyX family protein [Gammaproteobacteria bacterium]|nr:SlyX family protein [Gammaproteobacteria bacterium]